MSRLKQTIGNFGQELAKKYLVNKGYSIIAEHYVIKGGEIDLIANISQEVVFVEVKTRTSLQYGAPEDSVVYYKKQALLRSAERYLLEKDLYGRVEYRFDIIAIRIHKPSKKVFIKHLSDVLMN